MTNVSALPTPGDTLAGKYRINRVIGEGGMGIVFEAFHLRLQQKVAIKMLRPDVLSNRSIVGRFEREARAAATIQGPNVANVLDVDTANGVPYLVIEYLDGHDLGEELADRVRLPIDEAAGYVLEACIPIAQAHAKGIIHRDLKPSNLFLANVAGERRLKLIDFGISKFVVETDSKLTAGAEALGTPEYMSPEQVRQTRSVDHRTDIWSLGVILYELVTGTVPFHGPASAVIASVVADPVLPPRSLRDDVPEALDAVIMRMLEKDPARRFQDIRALATALAPFAAEIDLAPTAAKLDTLPPPAPIAKGTVVSRTMRTWAATPPPRRRVSPWLVAAPVVALAAGLTGTYVATRRPTPAASITQTSTISSVSTETPSAEPLASAVTSESPPPARTTPMPSASVTKPRITRPTTSSSPHATRTANAPATPTSFFDQRF